MQIYIDKELFQWEKNRSVFLKLDENESDITYIQFYNKNSKVGPEIPVINNEAKIPDYLLEENYPIMAVACTGETGKTLAIARRKLVDTEKLDAAMTATADAIREKTGSTDPIAWDAEKGMSEAVEPVFEAGKKSEYDAFWDAYQDYGNRRKYNNAFNSGYWNNITFNPKYNIILGSDEYDADNLFSMMKIDNLEKVFNDNRIILDTSNAVRLHSVFDRIQTIAIPTIDFKNCESALMTFYNTTLLKLSLINIKKSCTLDRTFSFNARLKDLYITGEIGNSINFTGCYSLTKDSIQNIINILSTATTSLTVTLSLTAVNNAFETSEDAADGSTSEEWLALANSKSNWNIALV